MGFITRFANLKLWAGFTNMFTNWTQKDLLIPIVILAALLHLLKHKLINNVLYLVRVSTRVTCFKKEMAGQMVKYIFLNAKLYLNICYLFTPLSFAYRRPYATAEINHLLERWFVQNSYQSYFFHILWESLCLSVVVWSSPVDMLRFFSKCRYIYIFLLFIYNFLI